MEAIGRLYDVVSSPTTTATYVSLKDTEGYTVLLVGSSGTTNATVTIAKDAAGTSAVAFDGGAGHGDGITRYLIKTGSTGLWGSVVTQAAANTVPTTTGTGDVTAFDIAGYQLPDGYKYVKVSHATATCVLVAHDLLVQRKPSNLRALSV
jgi:hypothetical protein